MVTQKFDLNMIPGKPKPIIRASQYDTGLRAFEVSLFAGTDTYTIHSGATLTVQGTKPDYTGFSYSATYSGNTVTFDCTDQMTACAGAVEVEIVVVSDGERVATANFVLQVEPAALKDDTIISDTDIPIIEQLPEIMEDMNTLISTFGGPNVATTAAEMTDTNKVYVYVGSETGYEYGHWYYYDATNAMWKSGGIYQSAGVEVDNTLSIGGMAADAKATGDALALKADIASPTFTGYPKAPTASLISYGTQIANTEFVQRLVMPLDDAVNGLEPTGIEMHIVVDGTTGTWAQGGKTNIYDLLPGDNVEVTAGERDAHLVWYTTQGGTESVIVSSSHTVTAGATGRWGTTDARKLAVLMEDTSGNDVSPAYFAINGVEKGLNERVDALETTKQDALTFDTTPTQGSTNPVTSGGAWEAVQTDKTLAVEDKAADAKATGNTIAELKSTLDGKVDTSLMQKCTLITTFTENRWNASDTEPGLLHTNGQVYTGGSYDNYCYYDIGDVSPGDVITSYRSSGGTVVTEYMQRVVAYDSNGDVLASDGGVAVTTYTVPVGVASVKVTVTKTVSNDNFMLIVNAEYAPVSYIPYTPPTQYYIATPAFIGEINIDADTDFDNKYLDFSMVNRVKPSECITGKFLNGVTGELSDNAAYFVTGYMPIRDDETLYLYKTYTLESANMRTIAVYNKDKELITGYGVNANTPSITYRDGMAYIRACILLSAGTGGVWQTPETVMIVANPAPISTPTYESKPKIKGEYTRKKIYVYSTDDESTVIQKMVKAYNLTNCDVIFERSTYMFGDVLPNVMTLYGLSRNEIPVGNNCRYYFNGATLNAEIDLETLGADFNCNLFGTQYKPTNFEMYDGILIATDTRYVVHDEAATLEGSYKHLYQNMVMEYHTNISTDVYRKCIGGGTGASGVVEIVGCKFTTDSTEVDVSYHGNAYDIAGAEFMVNVRNCWFSNSFRAGELSTNQTGKLIFANNSMQSALQTYPRWDTTSFLNEVRT